ncbi:MAG: hypothetical protein JOY99_12860 [Sphingomonadaceae bacterium]|nr:hypothetical protein [Sphingomonadaceae bacterium]
MSAPFESYQSAARALFNGAELKSREGQFVGGLAFSDGPLTDKQLNWLRVLLARHGLPPLDQEATHG